MKKDAWAGVILVGTALLVLLVLIPQGVVEPKKIKYAALSPSYYPRIVAMVLCGLGAVIALRSFWAGRSVNSQELQAVAPDRHPAAARRITIVFGLLLFYALAVSYLGFIVSSIVILLATFWLAGERRLQLILPLSVLLPFALYFFFLKVAAVPIPTGVLAPWLEGI